MIEDEITKVKSDVSDVETELLDTSVFAGADINQVQPGRTISGADINQVQGRTRYLCYLAAKGLVI